LVIFILIKDFKPKITKVELKLVKKSSYLSKKGKISAMPTTNAGLKLFLGIFQAKKEMCRKKIKMLPMINVLLE